MILLPVPKSVTEQVGEYLLNMDSMIMMEQSCPMEARVYAQMLREEISTSAGVTLMIARGEARDGDIALTIEKELTETQYEVDVTKQGIVVKGGSLNALGWGVQTLRQMVRQFAGLLPAVKIQDEPQMKARGFYHDITRGRIQTLEELKKLADTMAFYKLNQLQLYVEHSYLYRDLTEMWRDDTPLTAEEILELDQYCYDRGIELIPSIATFGHLYKALRTKSYAHICELPDSDNGEAFSFVDRMNHHTLNVSDPEAFTFATSIMKEYMSLFRTDKFNICADETFDLGKGKNAELAEKEGKGNLYVTYILKLFGYLKEQGKQPMFWGDIISEYPELIKKLPEDTICLTWGYGENESDRQVKIVHEAGGTQYVCPGTCGWNTWVNYLKGSYENVKRMCRFGRTYGAIGVLNTDWGDYGHINQPVFSLPGLIYGAVFSWGECDLSFEELNWMISMIEYRDNSGKMVELLADTDGSMVFSWNHVVYYKEWRQKNIPEEQILEKFYEEDMSRVKAANERIDQSRRNLQEIAREIDVTKRGIVTNIELSLSAMELWNQVGVYLNARNKEEVLPDGLDPMKLAGDLERLLFHFKEEWRKISKESDLYHIQEVFCWYADLLRSNGK